MSEKYDDDLRDFLENYVKNEEKAEPIADEADEESKKKYFKKDSDIERLENALNVSVEVGMLKKRVETLEVLNYGLWIMLKKKGFTDDEYDTALQEAKETMLAKFTAKKDAVACPKCGRLLQEAEIFGIKCIYCGYEQVANPYKVASEEAPAEDEVPQEFEAYDVTKDLGFDEEEV